MIMSRIFIRLLKKRTKRNFIMSIAIIIFVSLVLRSHILARFEQEFNISCYNVHINRSTFVPVLGRHLRLPSRSIFFNAISCAGNLTSRQHCAIESAAITHPEWEINVVFFSPPSLKNFAQGKFKNVKLWRININDFAKETPFEQYINNGVLRKCRWNVDLTTDVFKYLVLSTWGGIYMDLDMVVARPLGSLVRNWATREDDDTVGESILALSKDSVGRNVSVIAVKEMQLIFKRRDCSDRRPTVIMNALKTYCSTPDIAYMSSATCNGFEVYGSQFFHPIPESRAREYFIPRDLVANNAYTYHLWTSVTKEYKAMRTSPFVKLARRYCPATVRLYADHFGLTK